MWRVAIAASLLLAACGSSGANAPGRGGTSATSGATSPPPSPHTVVVTKLQNHTVVPIRVGDVLKVRLDSTYWRFGTPSGSELRSTAKPSYAPNRDCVPGGGCGTVTAEYEAVRAGTAAVRASRTVCGEVVRCLPPERTFTVTIVIRG
jgi:hypothetical protein